ncbi:MAG: hypothetical protein LUE11_11615 [Clostridia bacterium]|nr:hypothetical protein [Clostridia bacterium]
MKKAYEAPSLEYEAYELNSSIAANCGTPVSMGPAYGEHQACDEFSFEMYSAQTYSANNPFYDDTAEVCSCYYSSGNNSYFTS